MAARWAIAVSVLILRDATALQITDARALFPVQLEPLRGSGISRKTGRLPRWETRSACRTQRWATMRLNVPELTRVLGKHSAMRPTGAAHRQDSEGRIVPQTRLPQQIVRHAVIA